PSGVGAREWRGPGWQGVIAGTLVPDLGLGIAASELDASLWLAAHDDHKFRVLTRLRAQLLVGDDQGRSPRRYCGAAIQCVLWNSDPVKGCFGAARVGRHRLDARTAASARGALRLFCASICMSTIQRDHAPSDVGVAAGALDGGEDMRADRAISIPDR